MKIGVFDSGIGGKSVANVIEKALPDAEVIFVNDSKNVPYGSKTPEALLVLVEPILQNLAKETNVIVVACNTVSTTLIDVLRDRIKVPLVAMEPMVKPAAELTKSTIIAVCATPTTLASKRYAQLKEIYAKGVKVIEPDCSNWTSLIESKQIDNHHIHEQINSACEQGADVIVLGCTHYHWIQDIIAEETQGRAQIIQPEQPVIEQLKRVIARL